MSRWCRAFLRRHRKIFDMNKRKRIVLLQLPIPPLAPGPAQANSPLAAAYLKLFARRRGLEAHYDIEIMPSSLVNELGDRALAAAILERRPWAVGMTCYLWNVERVLWLAERLKEQCREVIVLVGGPEITPDNAWVLSHPCVDGAVIGEGEQTFAEWLGMQANGENDAIVPGMYRRRPSSTVGDVLAAVAQIPRRAPLTDLDEITSPYLEGILDAAAEGVMLLETVRGCVFRCKFCYYPKSYEGLYFLSQERLRAQLDYAVRTGVTELVFLDPTLNQRRDFADLLRLVAQYRSQGHWTCFGELRAEGITEHTAQLLRAAGFHEVEVGLQSIDPQAQELMDRKNHLRAFERGVRALLDAGIRVRVDLILGLPGDTPDSIRRGLHYLCDQRLFSEVQLFHLAVLPGTAFRREAATLGLEYQDRPPYYVRRTPTLAPADFYRLVYEAQELFELDWDTWPEPALDIQCSGWPRRAACVVVPASQEQIDQALGAPADRAQTFTLWLRSADFERHRYAAASLVEKVLQDNPFSSLQVVLEPTGPCQALTEKALATVARAARRRPTYLDRYYAFQPGRPIGAVRLLVVMPASARQQVPAEQLTALKEWATLVWRGDMPGPLDDDEYLLSSATAGVARSGS